MHPVTYATTQAVRPSVSRSGLLLAIAAGSFIGCARSAPRTPDPAPARAGEPAARPGQAIERRELDDRPVARTEELLEGRFPGVRVIRLANGVVVTTTRRR